MEVIIYDGPPSIGATHWVGDRIAGFTGAQTEIVTNFIRVKSFLAHEFPNKEVLADVRRRFQERIDMARDGGKKTIFFDGSPITINALEHLQTGAVSTKSRKAVIRCIEDTGAKVTVVLLKPEPNFQGVGDMKCFDPRQVIPFGDSLEQAYQGAGCNPTIVQVKQSPYLRDYLMRRSEK